MGGTPREEQGYGGEYDLSTLNTWLKQEMLGETNTLQQLNFSVFMMSGL